MSDNVQGDAAGRTERDRSEPGASEAVQATETYRTDGGTVFYDADNPLAWMQTESPLSLREWN